ncbi:sodium:solute symporter family protein [Texcoconibacillus texcoconensis]|uniref:Cation/acetate symporter n=1 Tax=Texcoconibacillus texcoconensis TaxID=1095777 RepID=A0A840QLZ6_9BACI|nr:sodium:solute symporter family protein [Texcoconibacillus texcoconensis]MBB5172383.1 cation/acetate symporter [Texcoconibacillus texcoconensis]
MDQQTLVSLSLILVTFAIYIGISFYHRAKATSDFYVASRGIPPMWNGMAIGGDWMSAASFIGMAGTVMLMGYDGLAYIMGWTGGYLLLTFLLAPQLRKYGRFTVPEFIGDRFDNNFARLIAALATIIISFTYLIGQLSGSGVVIGRLLSIPSWVGVLIGVFIIAIYATLGGMKGVTWTQVAQYLILITAYIIPIVFISLQVSGNPLPWLTYGSVVDELGAIDREIGLTEYFAPFDEGSRAQFIALLFTLMVGTAALPHVIVRFYTVSTMKAARWSGAWALLFIGILYLSAPAYAAFSRFTIMNDVVGEPLDELPGWTEPWVNTGLLEVAASGQQGVLTWQDLVIDPDIVVMATPEIANLGTFVIGLIAAGAMAAALSTAGGLLITVSSSFAHDIYYRLINPKASDRKRLKTGRIAIFTATIVAGLLALDPPGVITQIVAWAFAIAGGTFFPVLFLGVWWSRMNAKGAIAGMLGGLLTTLSYIFLAMNGFILFGIEDTGAGLFGVTVNFILVVLVSKLTEEPPQHLKEEAINLRYPEQMTYKDGEVWIDDSSEK